MNIFWVVGAVFKEIMACSRKRFISFLIRSSILQQYLLYVSTLTPFPFKVSACQHFGLEPCTPSKVSAVSIFWLKPPTSPPPKHADIILEHSLTICKVSLDFFFFWVGLPRKFFDGHNKQFKDVSFAQLYSCNVRNCWKEQLFS